MARAIHGLPRLSQQSILAAGLNFCPVISDQQFKADAYQILYIVKKIYQSYDRSRVNPDICIDSKCIIKSLQNSEPVIMLRHEHAVLIVGADYESDSRYPDSYVIKYLHILDPASPPDAIKKERIIPFLTACGADLFIAY
jgi:hypothetical protein